MLDVQVSIFLNQVDGGREHLTERFHRKCSIRKAEIMLEDMVRI